MTFLRRPKPPVGTTDCVVRLERNGSWSACWYVTNQFPLPFRSYRSLPAAMRAVASARARWGYV